MKLAEFAALCQTTLVVQSGFNGKILCRRFDPKKHAALGEREVLHAWADIQTSRHWEGHAEAVIMVYVDGAEECDKEMQRRMNHEPYCNG